MNTEDIGFGGLKLAQDPDGFRYGIDAVILADFAFSICPEAENIIDLGTGNGIIPLILSHKNGNAAFTGLDIQEGSRGGALQCGNKRAFRETEIHKGRREGSLCAAASA